MNDDVMIQLKRHLASAEQIDVSRYQFVNMERVREAAGHRWPELRERAFIASRSIMERHIAEEIEQLGHGVQLLQQIQTLNPHQYPIDFQCRK